MLCHGYGYGYEHGWGTLKEASFAYNIAAGTGSGVCGFEFVSYNPLRSIGIGTKETTSTITETETTSRFPIHPSTNNNVACIKSFFFLELVRICVLLYAHIYYTNTSNPPNPFPINFYVHSRESSCISQACSRHPPGSGTAIASAVKAQKELDSYF